MSTTAAVFERRNKQIQDAINSQNLKQALQLCEKRLKKGEDTPFLRAWKANILFSHADPTHKERGISESLELCHAKPPITDIEALDILQKTLGQLDEHAETARSVWENAAKAKPQDADIQLRWFHLAAGKGDWKTAQKAAMILQNNFPKKRKYYFWAVFMCHLVAENPNSSAGDRKLFGTLAYRMISKAAASVPADPKELLSPARAIQSAEELLLLIKIYESQGRYDEIVTLLNSENLGINSRIVQSDWSFVTTKLDALEKVGNWQEALSFAQELLHLADDVPNGTCGMNNREKDDWKVWNLLLTAARQLDNAETDRETKDFISKYSDKCPVSRNAQLANLELVKARVDAKTLGADALLSECKGYFDRTSTKLYCFSDLRKHIALLDPALQQDFRTHISQANSDQESEGKTEGKSMILKINVLKFEYCFWIQFGGNKDSELQVADFARRCLILFQSTNRVNAGDSPITIENQPTDDLCLLAAMSLIRLHEKSEDAKECPLPTAALIQAAGILEHLILKSPHNYEALLLLVRIYLLLGAGSLAIKAFSKLTVKQMQYETVAHNLFTRLSTIHPHAAPPSETLESKDTDPQMAMRQALKFYRGSETSISYARKTGLDNGSYVNVEKSIGFQASLQNSICRRMWALETRRIQRMVGGPSTAQYDSIVSETASVVDKRNFAGFMNCEFPGGPAFEERVRVGPLPRDRSVETMARTDILFSFLNRFPSQKKIPADTPPPPVNSNSDFPASEMTSVEIGNAKIHLILLQLISDLLTQGKKGQSDSSPSSANVDNLMTRLESWLTETRSSLSSNPKTLISLTPGASASDSSSVPSWLYFHTAYSTLETLKAVILFTTFASKLRSTPPSSTATKVTKEGLTALSKLALSIVEEIKTQTRTLKSNLSASGLLGQLVDVATNGPGLQQAKEGDETPEDEKLRLSRRIEELVGMSSLELFCGSLMESWEEALDGVLTVCGTLI